MKVSRGCVFLHPPVFTSVYSSCTYRHACTQEGCTICNDRCPSPATPSVPPVQAAAVSSVLQRTLGWGVQVVTDLGGDSEEDEDAPVVVEGVELPEGS